MANAGKVIGSTAGGMGTGAAIGTSIMPGWGTAIGGGIGAIGGFFSSIFGDDDEPKSTPPPDPRALQEWLEAGQLNDYVIDKDGDLVSAGRMSPWEAPKAYRDMAEGARGLEDAYFEEIERQRRMQQNARDRELMSFGQGQESRKLGLDARGQSQAARELEMAGRERFGRGLDTLEERAQGRDLMAHRAAQIERERTQAMLLGAAGGAGGYSPAAQRAAMMSAAGLQAQQAGATALAAQREQRGYQDDLMRSLDAQRMRDQGMRSADFELRARDDAMRQLDQYGRTQEQQMRKSDQAQQTLEQQWWAQQNARQMQKENLAKSYLSMGLDEKERQRQHYGRTLATAMGQNVAQMGINSQQAMAEQRRNDALLAGGLKAGGDALGAYFQSQGAAPPQLGGDKEPGADMYSTHLGLDPFGIGND